MAAPYHHALSSVKKWGGTVEDFLPLHQFLDSSKKSCPDFRHRALYHHSDGIFLLEQLFGVTITLSTGRVIPTRWVGEQHCREDFRGKVPAAVDWLRCIRPEPWMAPRTDLEAALKEETDAQDPDPEYRQQPAAQSDPGCALGPRAGGG